MRSKSFMSKINLQRGKLTVENRKSREKKTDMLRSITSEHIRFFSLLGFRAHVKIASRIVSYRIVCCVACGRGSVLPKVMVAVEAYSVVDDYVGTVG